MTRLHLTPLIAALFAAGCTWVTPTPEAQALDVKLMDITAVAHCQLLTDTELTVADKLGKLERMPADVAKDLQTMAINQAAAAGGDAVVARDQPQDGKQSFGLYRCLPATASTVPAAATTPAASAITRVKTFPYNPPSRRL